MRLGRLVEHDERSWNFQAARAPQLVSVEHKRRARPFDQGQIGSCTGNALTGCLDTAPFTHSRLGERTALKLYSLATQLDGSPGTYPPDDTGSSGLAVCKAAVQLKYISGYTHAFGLQHALEALTLGPVITGIPWFDSFDQPVGGLLSISPNAGIRGGHEIEVNLISVEHRLVGGFNSWGPDWGLHGRWLMSWDTWSECLAQQGDVTCPIP
jgi:hypothetical protein